MKFNLTFILLLFFLLSCRENSSLHINSLVAYEPMSFQLEELILYQKFCHDSIVSSNERFEGKITVLNAVGQVVHRIENLELTQGEHDFRIPSSFLARGVYIVALETADVVLTKRVVVGN